MPTTVHVPADVVDQMYRHAQATYPYEACGILIGSAVNGARRVVRIVETENVEPSRQHDRFLMDPKAVLQAEREVRGTDEAVLGFYHSHPDHPCEPSQTDFAFASLWPDHAFLIVEVRDREAVACRSWVVHDAAEWFEEEPVEIA